MKKRWEVAGLVLILFAGIFLNLAAYQATKSVRFEIGSMDRDYLESMAHFHPPVRMNGPLRNAQNTVENVDFYGRLTRQRAVWKLPYHAFDSPLRLRVRCHRFGVALQREPLPRRLPCRVGHGRRVTGFSDPQLRPCDASVSLLDRQVDFRDEFLQAAFCDAG